MVIFAVMLIGVVAYTSSQEAEKERIKRVEISTAKREYTIALNALEANPEISSYRITALEAGRRYAGICRKHQDKSGVTIFDEVALQNDIHARCGSR